MKDTTIFVGFIIVAFLLYLVWGDLNSKLVAIESDTGSYIYEEADTGADAPAEASVDLEPILEQLALLEAVQKENTKAIENILKRLEQLAVQDCGVGNCASRIVRRETIYFGHDDSQLSAAAMVTLDKLLASISDSSFVTLRGHADTVGDNLYNHLLSLRRAATVKRYLDEKLGADNRSNKLMVSIGGSGEESVVNATADEVDEPSNRVVEILIFE